MLEARGLAVVEASDLAADLLLLDLPLPDGDGFAVAEAIARSGLLRKRRATSNREVEDLLARLTAAPEHVPVSVIP